jgi:hypothetical protein
MAVGGLDGEVARTGDVGEWGEGECRRSTASMVTVPRLGVPVHRVGQGLADVDVLGDGLAGDRDILGGEVSCVER